MAAVLAYFAQNIALEIQTFVSASYICITDRIISYVSLRLLTDYFLVSTIKNKTAKIMHK